MLSLACRTACTASNSMRCMCVHLATRTTSVKPAWSGCGKAWIQRFYPLQCPLSIKTCRCVGGYACVCMCVRAPMYTLLQRLFNLKSRGVLASMRGVRDEHAMLHAK
eukprot:1140952-Pelagomonas_calceolata.AAC.2